MRSLIINPVSPLTVNGLPPPPSLTKYRHEKQFRQEFPTFVFLVDEFVPFDSISQCLWEHTLLFSFCLTMKTLIYIHLEWSG